jgi:hypothetical protein
MLTKSADRLNGDLLSMRANMMRATKFAAGLVVT